TCNKHCLCMGVKGDKGDPGSNALVPFAALGFGNVARVDQVLGNDADGAINGLPFKTIGAAINKIPPGGGNYAIWIMPGFYEESNLNLPQDVQMVGMTQFGQPSDSFSNGAVVGFNTTQNTPQAIINMNNRTKLFN